MDLEKAPPAAVLCGRVGASGYKPCEHPAGHLGPCTYEPETSREATPLEPKFEHRQCTFGENNIVDVSNEPWTGTGERCKFPAAWIGVGPLKGEEICGTHHEHMREEWKEFTVLRCDGKHEEPPCADPRCHLRVAAEKKTQLYAWRCPRCARVGKNSFPSAEATRTLEAWAYVNHAAQLHSAGDECGQESFPIYFGIAAEELPIPIATPVPRTKRNWKRTCMRCTCYFLAEKGTDKVCPTCTGELISKTTGIDPEHARLIESNSQIAVELALEKRAKQAALARAFEAEAKLAEKKESKREEFKSARSALVDLDSESAMPKVDTSGCKSLLPCSRLARIGYFFFPERYCEAPKAPEHFEDVLVQKLWLNLSWLDLLRVIISRRVYLEFQTATRNKIGESVSSSSAHVLPPKWLADGRSGGNR